jgi:hypothetical protein
MTAVASAGGERLDLRQRGTLFGRLLNRLRRTLALNWLVGWKTLDQTNPIRCCSGRLARLHVADDGDIVLNLEASAGGGRWACDELLNERNATLGLVCELPLREREHFSNLSELRASQQVRVCGRWVCDRAHGHNELHPISSIEILRNGTRTG